MQDYGLKMAYKYNFIKITALGQLAGTDEIFSFGLHFGSSINDVTSNEYTAFTSSIDEIAELVRQFWVEPFNGIPNQWQLTSVKMALIATNGKYETWAAPEEFIFDVPISGPDVNGSAPQLAAVVTLQSQKPRDPGKYNRFYVPTRSSGEPRYAIGNQTQQSLADSTVTMIDGIADLLRADKINMNSTVVSASGTGFALPTQRVKVGSVIDTQRRRRNKLPENYVYSDLEPV